jgi:hypothetical protein
MIAADTPASIGLWGPTLAVGILTAAVGLLTLAVNQIRARKDRQRELFADAFATVTEYREYPFIVRRRDQSGSDKQAITSSLSAVQARLNQHAARLRVEAPRVGRAYAHLVRETRRVAGAEITRAWDLDPLPADGPMHVRDVDLRELDAVDDIFLREVGDHLAVLPSLARRPARRIWAWCRHPHIGRRAVPAAPRVAPAEARQ